MPRYFLRILEHPEVEVTEEEFIRAERATGFWPKADCGPVATGGFSAGVFRGRVEYADRSGRDEVKPEAPES